MSRKAVIILSAAVTVIVLAGIFGVLWSAGFFISDRSVVHGIERVEWKGRTYSQISGEYELGKRIAKTTDGCDVYEIAGDPEHNFILISSFRDSFLYVDDGYTVPQDGEITKAYWNYKQVKDAEFMRTVTDILAERKIQNTYTSESGYIFIENEVQDLEKLCLAYDNCPVATVNAGYMGKLNGRWIITVTTDSNLSQCTYYNIPSKYNDILEKHF